MSCIVIFGNCDAEGGSGAGAGKEEECVRLQTLQVPPRLSTICLQLKGFLRRLVRGGRRKLTPIAVGIPNGG
jgi:hypothetical protein